MPFAFMSFLQNYWPDILARSGEHLWLSLIAVFGAIAIGLPLGIGISRSEKWRGPILGVVNVLQTVPSLALFGFLLPLVGVGARNAVIALLLYSLLPIVRNTFTGIMGVDPAVREAARAMGMTDGQILRRVELPLAADVILAGIRTATVLCIGITTIAAYIGAGGLGDLVYSGLRNNNNAEMLAGAVPATLLALGADWLLGLAQHGLQSRREGRVEQWQKSKTRLVFAGGAVAILLIGLAIGPRFSQTKTQNGPKIVVASKEFAESRILAEIFVEVAQKAGLNAQRGPELGGNLAHQALLANKIDVYPEYTGTAYSEILGEKSVKKADAVYQVVKQKYAQKFNLEVSPPLGFSNGFAMLVRGETAKKSGLKTLSDAVPYAKNWTAGFGPDFITRADGWPGLSRAYGLQLKGAPRSLDLGLLNRALASGQVDLIAGNETDGTIPSLGLVQLEDDRNYFPPYQGVFMVRQKALEANPKLRAVLEQLEGALSTEEMQKLNFQVDGKKRRPAEVAREWVEKTF